MEKAEIEIIEKRSVNQDKTERRRVKGMGYLQSIVEEPVPSLGEVTTRVLAADLGERTGEDEGNNSHKLDENVEGGSRGILERISDGITDNGGLVGLRSLTTVHTLLDVLLGVIPSTSGVGGGDGHLDTRDEGTSEKSSKSLNTEEVSGEERGEHDEGTRGDHLLERSIGRDGNATRVVGSLNTLKDTLVLRELATDLFNHGKSGLTDRLHGHGGEPVGKHSSDEETSELEGLEDIDRGLVGGGDEGTEKSERDESGGTDGESLSNSGGGVTGGIESVSALTDVVSHTSHLGDTSGVIADRTIGIDGKTDGHGGEDSEGGGGDSVHTGEGVGNVDGDSESEHGDDDGLVSEGKTIDDVGGGTSLTSVGDLTHGGVRVRGVVLGDVSDDETSPETTGNADEHLPVGGVDQVSGGGGTDVEVGGEEEVTEEVHNGGLDDGGDEELTLERGLDVFLVLDDDEVRGDERSDHAHNDTRSGDHDGEDKVTPVLVKVGRLGRDDHGSASRLGERSEKIGSHTGDITDVVTNVIGNDGGVTRIILRDVELELTA